MVAKSLSPREELADEELLERYLALDDLGSEAAFQALVERHGPMVLSTCRHVLNQHHDAEDAFQLTFLALARRGATIQNRKALAGWLHEVAYRIAARSRGKSFRRRALESRSAALSPCDFEPANQDERAAWLEIQPVLHEEVGRLPEKYRVPVVLSYFEGRTNEEVAGLLRWPVGTVKGRLSRARGLLRSRLSRRGVAISAAFLTTSLSRVRAAAPSPELVRETVRRAMELGRAPGPPALAGSQAPAAGAEAPRAPQPGAGPDGEAAWNSDRPAPRPAVGWRVWPWPGRTAVVLIVFLWAIFSASIGAGLSKMVAGEGFSGVRDLLSAPFSDVPPTSSCH